MSGGPQQPASRDRYLEILVFCVGAASLGAEIAAARLLAPFFGASTIVWANTIAVVLVSLSVGYALGGRIADRHPQRRALCRLMLVASALLAVVPFIARPFFRASIDALDSVDQGAFVGSLVGVLFLLAVPLVMLGAASPWAVRLALRDLDSAGSVAGRLFAVSTAGSLVGTFASALLLIPLVGTQRTFIVFAAILALVSASGFDRRLVAVPVALAGLALVPAGTVKASENGRVVLEKETREQYVRVVRERSGDVVLELNEGVAAHSVYHPGRWLTGRVWDGFLVLPFTRLDRIPSRVAILGSAAGTTARAYGRFFPRAQVDGVELDPELTALGRRYFGLHNPRFHPHHADARPWLERSERRYDVVMVDAYRQPYIPFYLATREFFESVREHLTADGVVIVNAAHPEGNADLERTLGRTMASAFPDVRRWPIERSNTLLVAGRGRLSRSQLRDFIPRLPDDMKALAGRAYGELTPRLRHGSLYTDDRAPVEWLIDRSILGYAADN